MCVCMRESERETKRKRVKEKKLVKKRNKLLERAPSRTCILRESLGDEQNKNINGRNI